jgi:hypothetical protein
MARLWYLKIKSSGGAVTIEDVPLRWRAAVREMLGGRADNT